MKNLKKWQTLFSKIVFNNPWCQVRQDTVELPSGVIIDDFFVNIRPDVALILPITAQQEIVFVRQYRHGIGEILLELPAGTFNPELESSLSAATRELEEETGYVADNIIKLATLYDNPVKDTNSIHLFIAENVWQTEKSLRARSPQQKLDITEEIEVELIPISQVLAKISSGEISVAGTVAAIFLGLSFLSQRRATESTSVDFDSLG